MAQDWFTRQLLESPEAADRSGLSRGARDHAGHGGRARAGLTRPPGRAFLTAMKELGLDDKVLLEAGLTAQREDGKVVPRFRARLLFPIHDLRGRAVGFGGRLLGPGRAEVSQLARDRRSSTRGSSSTTCTRPRRRSGRRSRSSWSRDTSTCFGWCSPASSTSSLRWAPRSPPTRRRCCAGSPARPRCSTTATRPGLRATFRAGDELLRHGVRVRVATLPEGRGPRHPGAKGWRRGARSRSSKTRSISSSARSSCLERKGWFEGVEHQREALDRLLPTIRAAADPITRDLYLKTVSERTGVSREVLREQAATRAAAPPAPPDAPTPSRGRPVGAGRGAAGRAWRSRPSAFSSGSC